MNMQRIRTEVGMYKREEQQDRMTEDMENQIKEEPLSEWMNDI